MKIQKPFTAKRILAIVLGSVVLALMVFMLFSSGSTNDTAGEMFMMGAIMLALSIGLIYYSLFGGK